MAAPGARSGTGGLGRGRRYRHGGLWSKSLSISARCRLRADPQGGALPTNRASARGRRCHRPFRGHGGVAMKVWHFSEMGYHPAWPQLGESYRVIIPSRLYDPKVGADLYHRYLDEWALCDELGINIMTNEHHATATCADSVRTIAMAILPGDTRQVRVLALGTPT